MQETQENQRQTYNSQRNDKIPRKKPNRKSKTLKEKTKKIF